MYLYDYAIGCTLLFTRGPAGNKVRTVQLYGREFDGLTAYSSGLPGAVRVLWILDYAFFSGAPPAP